MDDVTKHERSDLRHGDQTVRVGFILDHPGGSRRHPSSRGGENPRNMMTTRVSPPLEEGWRASAGVVQNGKDMSTSSRILVVAATSRELAPPDGWHTLQCGVGPVDAAAATAAAIALHRPDAILHVGIAGARRAAGLEPLTIVIGDSALYCDLQIPEKFAPRRVAASPELLAAARQTLPSAVVTTIGTSASVDGTSGCDVEAMEGFAVLRAAQLAGVPALEVRAISNAIEERDRALWRYDEAFAAIVKITPRLVASFLLKKW